jgi:hypothetical protein
MSGTSLFLALAIILPCLFLALFVAVFRSARRRGRSGWLRVASGNLLLIGFLLSLCLTCGELYYRFVVDETDGYAIGMVSERWFERHYRFNNFRIRDDIDYVMSPAAGRRRLTFLGDSYTNGHGVSRVEDRFVNVLRRRHPEWEIHFFGADGMETGDLVQMLQLRLGEGYGIQDVVYVYCLNDISDLIPDWLATARKIYDERLGFPIDSSYFLNTYYFRLKIHFDPALQGYFEMLVQAYANEHWLVQQRRLAMLRSTVERLGGRLVVVTFPFLEHVQTPEFVAIRAQLAEYWRRAGVPHRDLSDLYADLDTAKLIVNRRDTHPNEYAHGLAADYLTEFLEQSLPYPATEDLPGDRN